jgi:hypothetical protein
MDFPSGRSTYRETASFSPNRMNMSPFAHLSGWLPDEPCLNRALSGAANQATKERT